ncbi:MAG TPA: hypothetical protein VKW06_09640 [Candidatus Angelobacter sp.]|nr:hypothetical protein [Candidatus Angelobacter sp.]
MAQSAAAAASAQAGQAGPGASPAPATNVPPSISLSPAVIMARGAFGQGLTQTLTLTNNTSLEFAFELQAEDVVIKDGKRIFVAAGETANSIASSAVFSQKLVIVKPHSSSSVDVRLTLPADTKLRAVVAIFHGTNKLPTSTSSVGMTASLGALITFNLSDNVKLQPEALRVAPASESSNLTISQWVTNVGTEPVLPDGMAVLLNDKGSLVSKIPLSAQRLLPGERLEFSAEYPDQLQRGDYKAMCTLQFEGKTLTSDAPFNVR